MDKNTPASPTTRQFSDHDILKIQETLELLNSAPEQFNFLTNTQKLSLLKVTGKFSRPDRKAAKERTQAFKQAQKEKIRTREKQARAKTGIRSAREATIFTAPIQLSLEDKSETSAFATTGPLA